MLKLWYTSYRRIVWAIFVVLMICIYGFWTIPHAHWGMHLGVWNLLLIGVGIIKIGERS